MLRRVGGLSLPLRNTYILYLVLVSTWGENVDFKKRRYKKTKSNGNAVVEEDGKYIRWEHRVTNEEVLRRVGEKRPAIK